MFDTLTRHWWIQTLRGTLALTLGLTALFATTSAPVLAPLLIAVFAVGDGAMTLTAALGLTPGSRTRSLLLATGSVFIGIGLVVLFWTGLSTAALVTLFAVWLIASGILLSAGATALRRRLPRAWMTNILGIVTALAGVILMIVAPTSVDSLLPFAGWFGTLSGLTLLGVSLRLRNDARRLSLPEQGLAA